MALELISPARGKENFGMAGVPAEDQPALLNLMAIAALHGLVQVDGHGHWLQVEKNLQGGSPSSPYHRYTHQDWWLCREPDGRMRVVASGHGYRGRFKAAQAFTQWVWQGEGGLKLLRPFCRAYRVTLVPYGVKLAGEPTRYHPKWYHLTFCDGSKAYLLETQMANRLMLQAVPTLPPALVALLESGQAKKLAFVSKQASPAA